MLDSVPIGQIIKIIKVCVKKAEDVQSNKHTCAVLADNLSIIDGILSGLNGVDKLSAEEFKFSRVMRKIHRITARSNVLFDRCLSGKKWIRIRHFLAATSIKGELTKLQQEVPVAIGMLSLVFHLSKPTYDRGGVLIPPVDESVFSEEEEQSTAEDEEYYLDDDDGGDERK